VLARLSSRIQQVGPGAPKHHRVNKKPCCRTIEPGGNPRSSRNRIFVSRYFDTEGFDIGFSPQRNKDYMRDIPEIARFERERISPFDQLSSRYLVSISGTDVASSFGWQVSTNSVILRETHPWEVFFDCHFRPWEHYVPIKSRFLRYDREDCVV